MRQRRETPCVMPNSVYFNLMGGLNGRLVKRRGLLTNSFVQHSLQTGGGWDQGREWSNMGMGREGQGEGKAGHEERRRGIGYSRDPPVNNCFLAC